MLGIFLDTETNGLNAQKNRILELAYKIIDVGTGDLRESYQTMIAQPYDIWHMSNPESLHVNGFTWEQISHGKPIEEVRAHVVQHFERLGIKRGEAVFICQNPSFDRAFFSQVVDPDTQETLLWPYHWLDLASMYWAESIRKGKENPNYFPWKTGVSKDKIAQVLGLPSETKPHRAMHGVDHLLLCYREVIGFPLESVERFHAGL